MSDQIKLTAVILSFEGFDGGPTIYRVADYDAHGEVTLAHRVEEALISLAKKSKLTESDGVWYFEGTYYCSVADGGFTYMGQDLCSIIKEYDEYEDEAFRRATEY